MTRAKDRLHISYTKERFHRPQSESRFVKESGLEISADGGNKKI